MKYANIFKRDHKLTLCSVGAGIYAKMMDKINRGKLSEVEHTELIQHRKGCLECGKEGIK